MKLAEMPLTKQSASEVSRLYLNSKFKMLTSYEDDKQLYGIVESLQHEDFYNLTPEEKTKVLLYFSWYFKALINVKLLPTGPRDFGW